MKIVLPSYRKKSIFNNKKHYIVLSQSDVKKDYDTSFYGDIAMFLYSAKYHLISDNLCGFITNESYFKFLTNDMNNEIPEMKETTDAFVSHIMTPPLVLNKTLSIEDYASCMLCLSLIKGLTDKSNYDKDNILKFISEVNDIIESHLTKDQLSYLKSNGLFINSEIFIMREKSYYEYANWLENILSEIKELKTYHNIVNDKNIPNDNKKIGQVLSKSLLTLFLFGKNIISYN